MQVGNYVRISNKSKSRHAGRVGIVRKRVPKNSWESKSWYLNIEGVSVSPQVAESQLTTITCEEYNRIKDKRNNRNTEKEDSKDELYYVLMGDVHSVDGPFTLDDAEGVAAEMKNENPDAYVVILRAIKEAKTPRIVVDFDKL